MQGEKTASRVGAAQKTAKNRIPDLYSLLYVPFCTFFNLGVAREAAQKSLIL